MPRKPRARRHTLPWLALWTLGLVGGVHAAGEPPRVVQRVEVYSEPGRFAGWPANHGIWSWGDEILVGFSRGYDKDNGADYHIDADRPEDFLLARSKDGGAAWSIEQPNPPGAMVGTPGMRHGAMPPGSVAERPSPLREAIDFTQGKTWTDPFILRGNGGSQDIGYPRSVVRSDGKVVTVYAFHDRAGSGREVEAALWDPGSR